MHCHSGLPFPSSCSPDHEIGQLSCLPHSSASTHYRDGTVLGVFFFLLCFSLSLFFSSYYHPLHHQHHLLHFSALDDWNTNTAWYFDSAQDRFLFLWALLKQNREENVYALTCQNPMLNVVGFSKYIYLRTSFGNRVKARFLTKFSPFKAPNTYIQDEM